MRRHLQIALWIALLACSDQGAPAQMGENRSAVDRPAIRLDPDKVPAELRDLIPFAEQWGIGDDVIRLEVEEKSADAEKQRFESALTGRTAAVTAWLDSFPQGEPMSDEAAAFMFMLSALDEMQRWPD